MTQEEIDRRNIQIAKFMGYPTKGYWWHHPNPEIDNGLPMSLNVDICLFESSWDCLMPVWFEIKDRVVASGEFTIVDERGEALIKIYNHTFNLLPAIRSIDKFFEVISDFCIKYNESKH